MSSKKNKQIKLGNHSNKDNTKKVVVFWIGILFILVAISIIVGMAINGTIQALISGSVLTTQGIILVSVLGGFGFFGIVTLISSFFIKTNLNKNDDLNETKLNEMQMTPINFVENNQEIPQPIFKSPAQIAQPTQTIRPIVVQQGMHPTYQMPPQGRQPIQNSRVPIYRVNQPINQVKPQQRIIYPNQQNSFQTVMGPNGRPVIRRVGPMVGPQQPPRIIQRPQNGQPPRIIPRPQNPNGSSN